MFLEIDEVAVDKKDWELVLKDDEDAKVRIREKINRILLYIHIYPVQDDEIVVTVKDLQINRIIQYIQLYSYAP